MKNILRTLLCCFLVASSFSALRAQPTISCPAVNVGNDTILPGPQCLQLQAQPVAGNVTTSYSVQSIPYNPYPYNQGTGILLNIDDRYSAPLNIGFDFCFYDSSYNQCVIGSNGAVSFDITQANGFMAWAIGNAIPSPLNPMNCIFSPFHDIDPSIAGTIRWATYGTAPCRVFVASFENCAMFSCNNLLATQQIAIYETTNIIEVYIQNKPTCNTWNSGAAILGIHNAFGTAATVVPGRNYPTVWSATNEGWRFVPNGAPNWNVTWYQVGNPTPIATTDTTTVCPGNCSSSYYAEVVYTNCNGATVTVLDTIDVIISNTGINLNPTIVDVSCAGDSTGSIALAPSGGIAPYQFTWAHGPMTGTVSNLSAGMYYVTMTDSANCIVFDSFMVNEPPPIQLPTTQQDVACFGQATGIATVNPSGGTPGYTYNWQPSGATTPTATGLAAGVHTVIVTDSNGCMDTTTVTINQSPQITLQVTGTNITCNGGNDGTATATPGGGVGNFTYQWLPSGQTTATANNLGAGTHTVIVTDSLGCQDTGSVNITQPAPFSIQITANDVTCFGGTNGSATVTVSGGTQPYLYAWSPSGGNGATANNLPAGLFTVVIQDANGCIDSASVMVNEPPLLQVGTSSTDETCPGFCNGTVSVVPLGGTAPFTFLWNTPNNDVTATVQNLCSGNYNVTVTDANGCIGTGTVTVGAGPVPIANAGADSSFCEGEGGTFLNGSASGGGGSPYYYSWTCNNTPCGLSCVNCASPLANPTDTTVYYLVVTDQNGCTSDPDSVTVFVKPKPLVFAGNDTTICGPPAPGVLLQPTIIGTGPYEYLWIPGSGLNDSTILNPFANPDTTTIYTLVVTDLSTGCTSDATTLDTNATITIEVAPRPVAEAGPNLTICDGDTAQIIGTGTGAGPGYTFEWSPTTGLSNPTIPNPLAFPSLTTEYVLTTWSNGCPSFGDTMTVFVEMQPTVDAGPNRDVCGGGSVFLDGTAGVLAPDSITGYQWWPTTYLSDSTTEDVTADPPSDTWYYFQAQSNHGCLSPVDSVLVTIRETPIVEAGENITVCGGTGPFQLNGSYTWWNGVQPGDLQNVAIEWQPQQFIQGPNDIVDPIADPPTSMWFYMTVTYDSCTHTDSVLISLLNEVVATAEADTSIACEGDSVQLTATGGIGGANFTWSPAAGLSDPNSPTPLAAPDSTTTYQVIVNEAGCADTAEVTLEVIPGPDLALISSLTEGCAPLTVSFEAVTANVIQHTWNFGDSTLANGNPVEHTYMNPGTYQVTLYGMNTGGCLDSIQNTTITVYDSIIPDWYSDPEPPVEMVIPGSEVKFFDETDNAISWLWDFGNGRNSIEQNPVYTYREPGTYFVSLLVTNTWGCVGKLTRGPYVIVVPDLFIPNVFSPNGDGVNDVFRVEYSGVQPYRARIYSRWGDLVFESRNKQEPWEGKDADGMDVPEGVYFYNIRIGDRDFNGNITLMK